MYFTLTRYVLKRKSLIEPQDTIEEVAVTTVILKYIYDIKTLNCKIWENNNIENI